MANEIIVVEKQLTALAPRFDDMLRGSLMDAKALIAGVMIAVEKNPKLLGCKPQSIINSANTAAALRLPMDGASGQFFMLPFAGVAQPCVGYRGFNTIGARGGLSINAGVVREGDHEWDYREGSGGFVQHKKRLDNTGRVIAAWSVGSANRRPDVISIVGIGEIEEIMRRSPAYKNGADTPWKDAKVGFIAMAEKTPRRRLARSIPWQIDDGRFQLAAKLDENFDERSKLGYIDATGTVVESPIAEREPSETPDAAQLTAPRTTGQEVPEEILARARTSLKEAAEGGTWPLQQAWKNMAFIVQKALADAGGSGCPKEFKTMAEMADKDSGGSAL